jgi:hypothetical protein
MGLAEITLALFAAFNSIRIIAYIPQIVKLITDRTGASSISFLTWGLFLAANVSTVAYALVNRSDWTLAAYFSVYAACCAAILVLAYAKRRSHAKHTHDDEQKLGGVPHPR